MSLVWSKFVHQSFFFLLESHGKFFKGLYRVCWHMIYPFRWRLVKAGVDTGEKRQMGRTEKAGVEYVCWHSHNNLLNHNHPRVRRALPETSRDGLLQAAELKASSESQGQLLLHRNQNYSPFPPFLSLRPPRASEAARPLAPLASRERSTRTPREHLLQGKCEVLHGLSFSHHSQAAFVSCFVSFLIWLC